MDTCPCCLQELPPGPDLIVSLSDNVVIWKGIKCDLTGDQTVIMHELAKVKFGEWLATDLLMQSLCGGRSDHPYDKVVTVQCSHIRKRLRDKQIPIDIENSWYRRGGGRQYRLKYA